MTIDEKIEKLLSLTKQLNTQVEEKEDKINSDVQKDPENEIFIERKSKLDISQQFVETHLNMYQRWQEQLATGRRELNLIIQKNIDSLKKKEQEFTDKITSNFFADKQDQIKDFFIQIVDLEITLGIWLSIQEEYTNNEKLYGSSYTLIEYESTDADGDYTFNQELYDDYTKFEEYDQGVTTIRHNYESMAPVIEQYVELFKEIEI